jgi:6,7-dimethyl-8-ribityllumazine synthase
MAGRNIVGKLDGKGLRIGLVVSRFNDFICERLQQGAIDCLLRHGVAEDDLTVARVPGAMEIPVTAQRMARSGRYDAIICVGCVIRGETAHYDQVCAEVTRGVGSAALDSGLPVTFGVLTVDNLQQALERAGAKGSNKGWDAALAAIEMVSLFKAME